MALGEGTVLGGYRIVRLIGRGGMGAVYLADDVRLGRKVALKVLASETAENPAVRERFVRESQLAASLDHPHILPIYEAGEADGQLFIAMRYVPGPDLDGVIARDGPLPLERTVAIVDQVGSALDAAHAAGLIHRDVKPGNILVAAGSAPGTDHAYLTDFGLTKHAEYSAALTRSGQLLGSVGYVAPEVIENRPIDGRVDIYSLGCVLYECLVGSQPYPRDTEMATLYAHVQAPAPSIAGARPELPAAVDAVIAKAMAKAPEDRYQGGTELARALAEATAPEAAGRHLTRGFLFADLRGYTAYVEAYGDQAGATLLDAYRRLVRDVVRRSGGAEIKTEGDSFYVVFASASEAVRCGLAITAAAAAASAQDPARPIAVGVGIHAGETAETAEGFVGSAVNLAARICAQAAAGEVLVSDTVRGLTRTSSEVSFTSRGRKHLKGIAEPIAVYAASPGGTDTSAGGGLTRRPATTRLAGSRHHPRRLALAGVGTAIAIALIAILTANAFGGGSRSGPSPSAGSGGQAADAASPDLSEPPTRSPLPTRTPYPTVAPTPPILSIPNGGPLEPGIYRTQLMQPVVTFTVDAGWTSFGDALGDTDSAFDLGRVNSSGDRFTLMWSDRASTDGCVAHTAATDAIGGTFGTGGPPAPQGSLPVVSNLIAKGLLSSGPWIESSAEQSGGNDFGDPISIGASIDVSAAKAANCSPPQPRGLALFHRVIVEHTGELPADDWIYLPKGGAARITSGYLSVSNGPLPNGTLVAIIQSANLPDLEAFAQESEKLLANLYIWPSEGSGPSTP